MTNVSQFLLLSVIASITVGVVGTADAATGDAPLKPNIIWVMADDMGWGEVGIYPGGSEHGRLSTPNLDTFGREGIKFTNAYAGYTVCAPSRTTFFTGRHSGHFQQNKLPGTSLAPGTATTAAMVLQRAGYTTGLMGKAAPLNNPVEQGFDVFLGQVNQGFCHNMYPHFIDQGNATMNVNLTLNWKNKSRDECMADPPAYNYTVDITQAHSLDFIKQHAADASPFFLYMAFTVPHAGGWGTAPAAPESGAPVPSDGEYAPHTTWPDVERDHAAVVTYLDACVGELLSTVKAAGIDNKTLIFFATDNGAHLEGGHSNLFFNSTGGLLGHKRSLYEGGVRSPSMARWPGTIVPAVSDYPWAFWDALPTFSQLAGGTAPNGLDGVSILPTLLGKPQPLPEYLYWTWRGTGVSPNQLTGPPPREEDLYPDPNRAIKGNGSSGYGVRVGNWKGVVAHCAASSGAPSQEDDMMLFDLVRDPFETTDIAAANKEQVTSMINLLASKGVLCACFQC